MTAHAAYWFLPAIVPLTIYIAWNDMKNMKISNMSVYALVACYALLGPFALGLELYLWHWLHLPVVLAFCMLFWAARVMGGGDAKMIAGMSPFFFLSDITLILYIFVASLLGALVTHSLFRFTALRNLAPGWKSWDATAPHLRGGLFGNKMAFPKGFALSATLLVYLAMAAVLR